MLPPSWGTFFGCIIGLTVQVTLEVLGAAGAIWGVSDLAGLRTEENGTLYRGVCVGVGAAALFSFCCRHAAPVGLPPRLAPTFPRRFVSAAGRPFDALRAELHAARKRDCAAAPGADRVAASAAQRGASTLDHAAAPLLLAHPASHALPSLR